MLEKQIERHFFSSYTKIFFEPNKNHSIQETFYFPQRHQFDAIYFPTVGYRLKLQELTDGGDYACHAKFDQSHEFDYHFTVNIDRELKKCRDYAKIIKNEQNNKVAINVTDATDALIGIYKCLTTAIRKPHLITTKSSNRNSIVASNSMVKRTTGDGHSSIQKRHINSFDTTTVSTPFTTTDTTATIVTTAPPTTTTSSSSSIPVSHSNKQHSTMSDLELSTTTAAIPTTIAPLPRDNLYPMVLPYSMGKRKG